MRHLTGPVLLSLAILCFWSVRYPDDGTAVLDWAKDQAAHVARMVR